jgi:hypothetical protein
MHPYFREALVRDHQQRLLVEAVTIRAARPEDHDGLAQLAELDERRLGDGPWLLAEVDGWLAAALDLSDGATVADPFRPSAHLRSLLATRAAQMRTAPRRFFRRSLRPAH